MAKEIICRNGEVVKVDDEDYLFLARFTWYMIGAANRDSAYPSCLIYGNSTKRFIPMHQLISGGIRGTDHIDGDRLNNQKDNLRPATYQQNAWNARKRMVTCTGNPPSSIYKGVSKYTNTKGETLWKVLFKLTKKNEKPSKYFRQHGFKNEIEAALFYNKEVVKYRGEYALLNVVPEDSSQRT